MSRSPWQGCVGVTTPGQRAGRGRVAGVLCTSEWIRAFQDVCEGAGEALTWGLPELWVQTELYVRFRRTAAESGWVPFPQEVPYVTRYPHDLPRKRDWRLQGAIKWVDSQGYPRRQHPNVP